MLTWVAMGPEIAHRDHLVIWIVFMDLTAQKVMELQALRIHIWIGSKVDRTIKGSRIPKYISQRLKWLLGWERRPHRIIIKYKGVESSRARQQVSSRISKWRLLKWYKTCRTSTTPFRCQACNHWQGLKDSKAWWFTIQLEEAFLIATR